MFRLANLEILLKFAKDDKGARFESIAEGPTRLVITTYNMADTALGAGWREPTVVGHLGGRKLLAAFASYSIDQGHPLLLHYTFFVGEAHDG